MQRVVGPALLFTCNGREKNEATSAEVEDWLRKWKRGKERRALVTDLPRLGSTCCNGGWGIWNREPCDEDLWILLSDQTRMIFY